MLIQTLVTWHVHTSEQTNLKCFGCILSLQLPYHVIVLLTGACLISAYTKQMPIYSSFI